MGSVTFAIDESIRPRLDKFPWVNWSVLAREDTQKKLVQFRQIEEFRKIVSKSVLTQEKADELADKASWSLSRKYERLLKEGK
jgi:hypothetical protein